MKPLQQYFLMVLSIEYVVLTFESLDEILWCKHSNETSSAVLSHGTIYLECNSNFLFGAWNPSVWPFKWNLLSSTFTWFHLFFSMLLNNFRKFSWLLTWATFGSERVRNFSIVLIDRTDSQRRYHCTSGLYRSMKRCWAQAIHVWLKLSSILLSCFMTWWVYFLFNVLYLRGPSHPITVTKGVNHHPVNSVGRVQSAEPEVAGSDRQSHFFKTIGRVWWLLLYTVCQFRWWR